MKEVVTNCCVCGKEMVCKGSYPWRSSLAKAKQGTPQCSEECVEETKKNARLKGGKFLSKYNKEFCSERMKKNNPSKNPLTVEKGKATKRINGTLHIWKGERGGNGKLTKQQILLAAALGWETELVVNTSEHLAKKSKERWLKKKKLPTHFKIDVGNRLLKIAVEIDGKSHCMKEKRMQDLRKTLFLMWKGWRVLRFTNAQIDRNLQGCLKTISSII